MLDKYCKTICMSSKKYMRNKIILSCVASAILSLLINSPAYSVPTKWERVDVSLSELLSSGWQLIGIATSRVAYRNSISPGGVDEEIYAFSLTKNGKYILCNTSNPVHPIANNAGCRRLN
jgi:hypothetical protein